MINLNSVYNEILNSIYETPKGAEDTPTKTDYIPELGLSVQDAAAMALQEPGLDTKTQHYLENVQAGYEDDTEILVDILTGRYVGAVKKERPKMQRAASTAESEDTPPLPTVPVLPPPINMPPIGSQKIDDKWWTKM